MSVSDFRGQAIGRPRQPIWALLVLLFLSFAPSAFAKGSKLDADTERAAKGNPAGLTSVIVTMNRGAALPPQFKKFTRARGGKLGIINSQVLDLPAGLIKQLESQPEVFRIHYNRPINSSNYRTSVTTGTRALQNSLGLTGAGVGVAIIDSGITSWHDDLSNHTPTVFAFGDQRVAAFVDYVNGQTTPYDDEGHGTHVAGIIAGNGFDSLGQQAGAAPDATLVALKVLDANGQGSISNVIAALDWVLANHEQYNLRVVNLSVGARVRESFLTDPLTLAAKRVVDAGVVVVTAAGNYGRNDLGEALYGGITAPGNAPWVLTVGASSTNGTSTRLDDFVAGFSSRGPTYLDWGAKPDLVAPGHGTISLADPLSAFYTSKAQYLVAGSSGTPTYLSLSGTSMAAPVVAGTIALMLQANPTLTPNAVKAILQYTAQEYTGYNALTEGAGFLNAVGAVRLAQFFVSAQPGDPYPLQEMWSKKIIWGSRRLSGGILNPSANAYAVTTTWGAPTTVEGANIIWGTTCPGGCVTGANIIWGTDCDAAGNCSPDNIIWGTECDAAGNCSPDNIIWGTQVQPDNIIWGTECEGSDCDNIIWGTDCPPGSDCDNIIWGTDCGDGNPCGPDNIIWGTDCPPGSDCDNIIWGTDDDSDEGDEDNIIWGTSLADEVVWGGMSTGDFYFGSEPLFTLTDNEIFDLLSGALSTTNSADAVVTVDSTSTDRSSTTLTDTTSTTTTNTTSTTPTDTTSTTPTDTTSTTPTNTTSTATTDTTSTTTTDTTSTTPTDTTSTTPTDTTSTTPTDTTSTTPTDTTSTSTTTGGGL